MSTRLLGCIFLLLILTSCIDMDEYNLSKAENKAYCIEKGFGTAHSYGTGTVASSGWRCVKYKLDGTKEVAVAVEYLKYLDKLKALEAIKEDKDER